MVSARDRLTQRALYLVAGCVYPPREFVFVAHALSMHQVGDPHLTISPRQRGREIFKWQGFHLHNRWRRPARVGRGGRAISDRSLSGLAALYCDDSRRKLDETTETESASLTGL